MPATPNITSEEVLNALTDNNDVRTFLSWNAPGRPYKKHSKEYFINASLIFVALEIIIYLVFKDFLLMLVVFSLTFLTFALAIVPPHTYYYKISTQGVRVENHYFIWDELYDFYFMKRHGVDVLHIRTKAYLPGEITLVLGQIPLEQMKSVLLLFLPYREYVEPTFMDRAGDWLERNFPLEKSSAQ